MVGVLAAEATVLITGVASTVLLSVVAGEAASWVKMEPGLSELGAWRAAGAGWETVRAASEVGAGAAAVVVVSGVVSPVGAALAAAGGGSASGGGGVSSTGGVMEEGGSGVGAGGAGVGALTVASVVESAAGSGKTGGLVRSTTGSGSGSL